MPKTSAGPVGDVARGSLLAFLGDALIVPTGLLMVAYLTRRLGSGGYGLFALTAAMIVWVESLIATLFGRPTIRLVSEAEDWRPVASGVVRAQVGAGLIAAALVWALADVAGRLMAVPSLAPCLRLLAFELPLFSAALAHWNVAIALGRFRQRALGSATRWIARLALVVGCTEIGLSPQAAMVGIIVASGVELAVARGCAPIPLSSGAGRTLALMGLSMWPLWTSGVLMRAFERIDLLMLKGMGGSVGLVGVYAAAQSLCLLPALVASAVAPQLLAAITRLWKVGGFDDARALADQALRTAVWLVPIAAAIAGAATDIVAWLFGPAYRDASGLLALLIGAAVAQVFIAVGVVVFIAVDRLRPVVMLTVTLLVGAVVGHLLVIPRWGGLGAAAVTLTASTLGAAAVLAALRARVGVSLSWGPVVRAIGLATVVYVLASAWSVPVALAPLKFAALGALTLAPIVAIEGRARVRAWVKLIVVPPVGRALDQAR